MIHSPSRSRKRTFIGQIDYDDYEEQEVVCQDVSLREMTQRKVQLLDEGFI